MLRRTEPEGAPPGLLDTEAVAGWPRGELEDACRALASPVYLGDGVALCRILGRYKLYLDTSDRDFGAHVLLDGFWETWATQFMARIVRPGWVVADVGANFGYYSMLLADLVGPDGRVLAVEPNPGAVALLQRSVALNGFAGRTTISQRAAGSGGEDQVILWVPQDNPGHAAVMPTGHEQAGMTMIEVQSASMDALLAPGHRLDFIKIDAEGSEERIISGMREIFKVQRPAMVLEFNALRYADPAAFVGRLTSLYGRLRYIGYDGNAAPIEPERLLTQDVGQEWLLFLSTS